MMISQKIAARFNFLSTVSNRPVLPPMEVRRRVISSTKFVVGRELFDLGDKQFEKSLAEIVDDELTDELITQKRDMYRQYGRLPFPSIFIENETGGVLIEFGKFESTHPIDDETYLINRVNRQSTIDKGLEHRIVYDTRLITINEQGGISPIYVLLNTVNLAKLGEERYNETNLFPSTVAVQSTDQEIQQVLFSFQKPSDEVLIKLPTLEDKVKYVMHCAISFFKQIMMISYYSLMETLLYLNASNTEIVTYKPSKKELAGVVKVLHKHFEYKVLDIYRSKKSYESINDIMAFIGGSEETRTVRRAHMVRGHFCTRGDKLYWRRPHMRSRKNLSEVGFISKDYNLVSDS